MPLNEFYCPKCDDTFELIHTHDYKPVCKKCGCTEVEKKFPLNSHRWGQGVSVDNPKRNWHGKTRKGY